MGPRRETLFLNSCVPIWFLLLLEFVLNFRRVTDMVDLGECLSLGADKQSAVYLSSVQTPQLSSDNLGFGRVSVAGHRYHLQFIYVTCS